MAAAPPDLSQDGFAPGALGESACCTGTIGADWSAAIGPPNGAFILGVNGAGNPLAKITDGTSNTLLIGDKHVQFGQANNDCCLYNGMNINCSSRAAGINYPLATIACAVAGSFGRALRVRPSRAPGSSPWRVATCRLAAGLRRAQPGLHMRAGLLVVGACLPGRPRH